MSYAYNDLGLRTNMTVTGENTVFYRYDSANRLTTVTQTKFTAREDDGTGLYYYRARYYHPVLGRFVSEDPLEFGDGMNVYAYVDNDPINFFDSFGLLKSGCEELRDLRQTYKRKNVIERYRQIFENHKGGGDFDYVTKDPWETYSLGNKEKSAHAFGNYSAGYSAGYAGVLPQLDYAVVRVDGSAYALAASLGGQGWHTSQLFFAGDDWISVSEISLGFVQGQIDRVREGIFGKKLDNCDNCR